MTVGELIDDLMEFNMDTEVVISLGNKIYSLEDIQEKRSFFKKEPVLLAGPEIK